VLFPPARATDPTEGTLPATCSPDSGSSFPVGETTVTCAAQDGAGNRGTATFTVKVLDTGAPTLHLPDDRTVEATGPGGAPVTWAATATDTADPSVDVACSPASGETLPLGSTTVTCTGTDDAANQSTGSFHVNVVDTTPPALTRVDDVTQEATGPDGASVTFTGPTATDAVDGTVPVQCSRASGRFALGETTVTCSATDAAGNSDSTEFHVVVRDTTAPTLNLPAPSVDATSPSGATVTYTAGARDLVSGDVATTCTPASGTLFAIGTTTVTCSATDVAGNVRRDTFTVVVKSASTQVSDLATQIAALNLGQGTGPAVNTKLQEALAALNQSNSSGAPSACGKLGAADNQIQSQSIVKQIGQGAADALSAKVRRIRTVAGC